MLYTYCRFQFTFELLRDCCSITIAGLPHGQILFLQPWRKKAARWVKKPWVQGTLTTNLISQSKYLSN